jgi:hypothetical protein
MNKKSLWMLGCCWIGCGSAAGPGYGPLLDKPATITANLTSSMASPAGPVALRAALVWKYDGIMKAVGQDIAVKVDALPSHFTLDITHAPPPEAISSLNPPGINIYSDYIVNADHTRQATGVIMLYEDRNGNGQLDFIHDTDTTSPDRVVGVANDTLVEYLEGELPVLTTTAMNPWADAKLGFNLMREPVGQMAPPVPGCGLNGNAECGNWPAGSVQLKFSPLSESVDIELSGDPALVGNLCVGPPPNVPDVPFPDCNRWIGTEHAGCPAFDQPPPGTSVTCSADGTSFAFLWTAPPTMYLCQYPEFAYGSGIRSAGLPPPAGWPCP